MTLLGVRPLNQIIDNRGRVFEVLRREHVLDDGFGQIYVFTGSPGSVKGNHYHTRKTEWFCVIGGQGELTLCDRESQHCECITLTSDCPTVVTIPAGVAHAIRTLGDIEMVVLAYITESYDPEDPDTYSFPLA